jgi:hypothetical protein
MSVDTTVIDQLLASATKEEIMQVLSERDYQLRVTSLLSQMPTDIPTFTVAHIQAISSFFDACMASPSKINLDSTLRHLSMLVRTDTVEGVREYTIIALAAVYQLMPHLVYVPPA